MNHFSKSGYLNPPGLDIIGSGYVHLDTTWRHNNSQSPFSCLYLVEAGSGILTIDGQDIVMEKDCAYLIPANVKFDYRCEDTLVKLFLHFNVLGVDGLDILRNLQEIHACSLTGKEIADIVALYRGTTYADSLAFRHILYGILARILDTYPAALMENKAYSPMISKAMYYIQSNLSYKLSCKTIADELFVAEVTLRQHFKKETGQTPRQYIEDLILFKAKLYLKTSNMTINQISNLLGFYDQFYFSRRFVSRYGISPKEYRKLI